MGASVRGAARTDLLRALGATSFSQRFCLSLLPRPRRPSIARRTERSEGALCTEGTPRLAHPSPVEDELVVEVPPRRRQKAGGEIRLDLLRGRTAGEAKPVGDPLDVSIDGERGHLAELREDDVRRLVSHAGERGEVGVIPRDITTEARTHLPSHGDEVSGLRAVVVDRADNRLDARELSLTERRKIRVAAKELRGDLINLPVSALGREDHCGHQFEVIPEVQLGAGVGIEGSEPPEELGIVLLTTGGNRKSFRGTHGGGDFYYAD